MEDPRELGYVLMWHYTLLSKHKEQSSASRVLRVGYMFTYFTRGPEDFTAHGVPRHPRIECCVFRLQTAACFTHTDAVFRVCSCTRDRGPGLLANMGRGAD